MASFFDEGKGDQFLAERRKIRAAFELVELEQKGVCDKDVIGMMMQYLGAYPTQEELLNDILPQLVDDDDSSIVRYERFEPFMVRVLVDKLYEPDTEETLLQAFRVLDPGNKMYIDEATMVEYLTEGEHGFTEKEIDPFIRIAKEPQSGYIHYHDYIMLLTNSN